MTSTWSHGLTLALASCLVAASLPAATPTDHDGGAVHRTDMPPQWASALRPRGEASSELTLANQGKSLYTLLIPADAKEIEKKAAGDLQENFKLISGAEFPIVTEAVRSDADGPFISIGRTQALAKSSCQWKDADLAAEGYALEVIGANVYLYGGSGRGLIHGVYSLLEEDLDCRWYSTTSIDAPHKEPFHTQLVPRKFLPVLERRDPYILAMHDVTWSLRNKTNSSSVRIPAEWGGSLCFHYMGHTYGIYFPPGEYFAEHPEYYALVNGRRQPNQLCHTNEDVIRLSIEKTLQIFREHPEVTITAIGPNDGRGFCDCPNCKKLDEANGGRSGSFFHFVNRIAEGVKKEFPDNHLISLAYLDYATPPTQLKVDPYIIIQLCTDSHAWRYQFCFFTESEEYQKKIKAWNAADATVFIWDYVTDYVHFLVPMANWPIVADNTRFNIAHGARGIMYECEASDNDEMRGWVWAKQLWNPELDTRALLRDFIFGYYKEAAEPVWDYEMMLWDYWAKWHAVPHRCGEPSDNPLLNNLHCSYAPDGPMFTPEFMTKMRAYFTEAERLAQSEVILDRVKKAKIPLLYLELAQQLGYYSEFGDFVYGKSMRKPPAEKQSLTPLLDEFVDLCQKNQMVTFGIPITFEKITAKWRACIDMDASAIARLELPGDWIFTIDPEDRGVRDQWYDAARFFDAAVRKSNEFGGGAISIDALPPDLARLHVNRGLGWQQQGFPDHHGVGWYFQNLDVPDDLATKKHLYLYFLGVNEEAWVYVNGQLAVERTYATTGKSPGELWRTPFSVDIKGLLKPGEQNHIAVRVTHASGLGGIWLPVMALATDEPCTTEQLDKYRF